jgi:hypothetical protein
MTKTLRITSIIAAAIAVAIFVLPAVFGGRIDPEVKKFLDAPGVVEKFKEARGAQNAEAQSQVPPLVMQAQAFALYLNPPPPPPEPTPAPAAVIQAQAPRPKMVTPKFKLIGTSFYALHPEMSLALIDEPGKGLRWVRQAGKIEHLVIEKVENGKIIIRDGQRTEELAAERPPVKSLVKSKMPQASATPEAIIPPPAGEQPQVPVETAVAVETNEIAEDSPEAQAERQRFLDEITAMEKELEKKAKSDNADSNEGDKDTVEATKELLSEIQSRSVSKEEANNLEDLGQQLKEARKEPNQPPVSPPARRPMRVTPRRTR